MESKEEWITAAEAARLLKPVFGSEYMAQMTICKRAHSGLIRARAEQYMANERARNNFEIPKEFWWAEGNIALTQNWPSGDFDTWIDRGNTHLRAFNVSFLRADIEKMIPPGTPAPADPIAAPSAPHTAQGGRPRADWWDDLWIEVCRQLYGGELIPKKQGDIENAMKDWLAKRGEHPSDSTIRLRARKLWQAISREGEN